LKKTIQTLTVMLALCLAMAVSATAATAATAAPAPSPADQQFLASLARSAAPAPALAPEVPAVPAFLEMAGGHCPSTWCTAAARAACESQPLPGCEPGCEGLACDSKNCTEHCACVPPIYCG